MNSVLDYVVPMASAVAGGLFSHYGLPFVHRIFRTKTYYTGFAEDIGVTTEGAFHPPLYRYEFGNVLISTNGESIRMNGSVITRPLEAKGELYHGIIDGTGKIVDGRAYIEYKGEYPATNEVWRGVAIFDIPQAGPAAGFWMSHHTTDASASYALGKFTLNRKGKA